MNRRWIVLAVLAACGTDEPIERVGINEIASGQADGDWVEVMNASADAVSLEGWAIEVDGVRTDFADMPIDASGYVTLDGLDLSPGGGMLSLLDGDGQVVDEVAFPASDGAGGFGRLPDATANWQRLDQLTPGAPNR